MKFQNRSLRIVGRVLVVYILLVATHLGEFWPFSIYPMFSQAGKPWNRAIVRALPEDTDPDSLHWQPVSLNRLPGDSYPLAVHGINQNDLSTYLTKTERWTANRVEGLQSLFVKNRRVSRPLLLYQVRGEITGDSLRVTATPVMLVSNNETQLNPSPTWRTTETSGPTE